MILISTENVIENEVRELTDFLEDNYWKFTRYDGIHGKYEKHRRVEECDKVVVIDNRERVFMVTGDGDKYMFCNLADLQKICKQFSFNIKIYHFWNGEKKRISKEFVNVMLEANGINEKI